MHASAYKCPELIRGNPVGLEEAVDVDGDEVQQVVLQARNDPGGGHVQDAGDPRDSLSSLAFLPGQRKAERQPDEEGEGELVGPLGRRPGHGYDRVVYVRVGSQSP